MLQQMFLMLKTMNSDLESVKKDVQKELQQVPPPRRAAQTHPAP